MICISLLLVNRKEIEKQVLKLATEEKTTSEIAMAVHISLKDIGKIIRKTTGDEENAAKLGMTTIKESSIKSRYSFAGLYRSTKKAVDDFYQGYIHTMNKIGKEREWHQVTRTNFDAPQGPEEALLVGDPEEIVEKIIRHSKSLGGISRLLL